MNCSDEYGSLGRVLLCPAHIAFQPDRIEQQWRTLGYTAPPDIDKAALEYDKFTALLHSCGAAVETLADAPGLTLDAIYVRDASVITPRGVILASMGKAERRKEPAAHRAMFEGLGLPIAGAIEHPGLLEGGDVVWLDDRTVAVGRGYRTNDEGIAQFRALVGSHTEVRVVELPHYRGPNDVFHLMSIISPVDRNLAVVYSPLMSVAFRDSLRSRQFQFVEVPDDEFAAMGCNVLAVAPRRCVMVSGAPVTRARLEAAGCHVSTYEGTEISLKGGGGPTCLTRPLARV